MCCTADADSRKRTVVGGPCTYRSYPGEADIISMERMPAQQKGDTAESGKARYEVKFRFHTKETISESYAQVEGKTFQLMLTNGSHPSRAFLEKYELETGKTYPCHLKVITKGTCTPMMFDFPTIDCSDYSVQ